jgi:hypothetical protein
MVDDMREYLLRQELILVDHPAIRVLYNRAAINRLQHCWPVGVAT